MDDRILKIADKIKKLRIEAGYTSYEFFAWEQNMVCREFNIGVWEKGRILH